MLSFSVGSALLHSVLTWLLVCPTVRRPVSTLTRGEGPVRSEGSASTCTPTQTARGPSQTNHASSWAPRATCGWGPPPFPQPSPLERPTPCSSLLPYNLIPDLDLMLSSWCSLPLLESPKWQGSHSKCRLVPIYEKGGSNCIFLLPCFSFLQARRESLYAMLHTWRVIINGHMLRDGSLQIENWNGQILYSALDVGLWVRCVLSWVFSQMCHRKAGVRLRWIIHQPFQSYPMKKILC